MLVQNYTTGRLTDDTRNNAGDERPTVEACIDYAYEIQAAKELAAIAVAMRKDVSAFVAWLGDATRQHAIDNELCGNYERFLSIEVAEYLSEQSTDGNVDDVRQYVCNATRPRRTRATVMVPVEVDHIGRDHGGEVDTYTVAYNLQNGNASQYAINNYAARVSDSEVTTLDYHEAQRANEEFHRRGTYNYNSDNDRY